MKSVVGLGNPGAKYEQTKHNIGFMCLDYYANKNNLTFKFERKFNAEVVKEGSLILVKPQTFMNLSGQSVRSIVDYYDIAIEDVLIVFDDLALPLGKIRLREQGGTGGHNGMKSIVEHLHTDSYKRLRIGIDSNPLIEAKDYVLGKFSKDDLTVILESAKRTYSIISQYKEGRDFPLIMNDFNQAQ